MAVESFTVNSSNLKPPHNRTVIVTGGSGGIGLATSSLLASYNNTIASLDRSPLPSSAPSSIKHISCDLSSWASQRSAFSTALSTHFATKKLDAVFINAGIGEHGNLFSEDLDSQGELAAPDRSTLDIDVHAVVDSLKLAIYHMRNDRRGQTGGTIVMTASLAGYLASAGAPMYSAAKFGVVGLLRALKADCATLGISISLVAPGIALTNLVAGRKEGESVEVWGERMRKLGVPINSAEDVARVVVWLMGQGKDSNGKGILLQGGRCADVEAGIAKSRAEWMGKEQLELFRGGRNAPLFPNKL